MAGGILVVTRNPCGMGMGIFTVLRSVADKMSMVFECISESPVPPDVSAREFSGLQYTGMESRSEIALSLCASQGSRAFSVDLFKSRLASDGILTGRERVSGFLTGHV